METSRPKHSETQYPCPSCQAKLEQAIPFMRDWFQRVLLEFPKLHISWSYRDLIAQNKAVAEGKSKLCYPLSQHNKTDAQGNPQSWALDLFEQFHGIASFDPITYVKINEFNEKNKEPISWGGKWKLLGDADHFSFDENAGNGKRL
jgi:hypothetical protein